MVGMAGFFIQHLKFAQGSLKELETHLIHSTRVGLAVPLNMELALKLNDEIGKMLRSLIRSLQDGRNDRTY